MICVVNQDHSDYSRDVAKSVKNAVHVPSVYDLPLEFPLWFRDARVDWCIIEIIDGVLHRHDGFWEDGTWENGIWKNGTWINGAWYGSIS